MPTKRSTASTSAVSAPTAVPRYVVVTTAHRGVFFGRLAAGQVGNESALTLEGCRNVIQWKGGKGFLSLPATGPAAGSKIGATAPRVLLHAVTSVSECSPAAAAAFEAWP